ncbi:MAG: TolC family protein [Bacteroidaceae bacterium]
MNNRFIIIILLICNSASYAQRLSLENYRERVLNYSLVLKQSKEEISGAIAGKKIAFKGYLPFLDVNANGSLDLREINTWAGEAGDYRNHTYSGELALAQPLYTGGLLKAKNKVAQSDVQLSYLNQELTLDEINYQSDATYWNVSARQALYHSAQEFYQIIKKQHDIISDRFTDGMISRTDLLMISNRLKEAELQQLIALKDYTLAAQSMNILMGLSPNAPIDSIAKISIFQERPVLLPLSEVLLRRADYLNTEINITRQKQISKIAIAKFNPQLNFHVNGGWGDTSRTIGRNPVFFSMANLSLNIPILRWGERKQTKAQGQAFLVIKELQQDLIVDRINEQLCGANTKIAQSESQVKIAIENTNLAQENLDIVTFSYNEGKASMVDVLSAQLSWAQAQSNVINAYLSHKMALTEYRKVVSEE